MFDETVAVVGAVGAVATAFAVFVAVWELRTAKAQARTSFEDDLSREYRAIIGELPAEAFYVNSELTPTEATRRAFYRYVDLSNEQLFLAASSASAARPPTSGRTASAATLSGCPRFAPHGRR